MAITIGQHFELGGPWDEVRAHLEAYGYTPDYSGNPDALAGLAIDQNVAETVPCPACGKTGRTLEAWANCLGGYGHAVAICKCGYASAF